MTSPLIHSLCGAAVGVAVRLLLPGQHGLGYAVPAILGAVGGYAADQMGQKAGLYRRDHAASFVMSGLGAMALMLAYGVAHH